MKMTYNYKSKMIETTIPNPPVKPQYSFAFKTDKANLIPDVTKVTDARLFLTVIPTRTDPVDDCVAEIEKISVQFNMSSYTFYDITGTNWNTELKLQFKDAMYNRTPYRIELPYEVLLNAFATRRLVYWFNNYANAQTIFGTELQDFTIDVLMNVTGGAGGTNIIFLLDLEVTIEESIENLVWDALMLDHLNPGSTGSTLNGAGGGYTPEQVADAVWDEVLSGHIGAGSASEILKDAKDQADAIYAEITSVTHGLAVLDGLLDNILLLLNNGTYGLSALKSLIDIVTSDVVDVYTDTQAILAELADPTYGLSAIRVIVQANNDELTDPSYGLSATKTVVNNTFTAIQNPTTGLVPAEAQRQAIIDALTDGTYGLDAIRIIVQSNQDELTDGSYGLAALDTQLGVIQSIVSSISLDLGVVDTNVDQILTWIGTPASPPDFTSLFNANEEIWTVVKTVAGGGLGERLVNQDGFLDGQIPPVWHDNGSGPVTDGTSPLDDVTVLAYLEDTGSGKWTRLIARTVTSVDGNWSLQLDDGTYILWFYRADKMDVLEWRAISSDGSVPNPTTDPRDYV